MQKRSILAAIALLALLYAGSAPAGEDSGATGGDESLVDSVCRLIESSAQIQGLPVAFLFASDRALVVGIFPRRHACP